METPMTWKDIRISVDLLDKVDTYREFLHLYSKDRYLWENENTLRRAIHRYQAYWLPLVAEWRTGDLEPPRDIKWVWHLHMLCPRSYVDYCMGRFRKVVPHKTKTSTTEERTAKQRTERVWKDKYLHEPFELENQLLMSSSPNAVPTSSSKLNFLVKTAAHQAPFLYQILFPHYKDSVFLRTSLDRYRQFLFIQKLEPNFCADPPHDIQLLWRIHMLHPCEYHADTDRALKYTLDPFSSLTAAAADDVGYMMSVNAARHPEMTWNKYFTEPFIVGGTVYRGSPVNRVERFPKEHNIQEVIDICELTIDDLVVSDINLYSKEKEFTIEAKRIGETSFNYKSIFKAKGKIGVPLTYANQKGLGTIEFDSNSHRGIEFEITNQKGRFCMRSEQHVATLIYNPVSNFPEGSFYTKTVSAEIPKISTTDPYMKFTVQVKAIDRKPHTLTMERDPFVDGQMPGELLQCLVAEPLWGAVFADAGDEDYLVARHTLRSKVGKNLTFSCHMIKHGQTDSTAVLLYLNDKKLVCMAHSISPEQLPNSDQVSSGFPLHMDPQLDHAMLVRNSSGDWCVIKGSWMSETMPGYGKVQISVYNLQTKSLSKHTIRDDEMQSLKLEHVTVDMPTGRMTLGPGCEEMAENITLALCAGILFLSCQKKAIMIPALNGSVKSLNKLKAFEALDNTSNTSVSVTLNKAAIQPTSRFNSKLKLQNRKRTRRRKISASFTFLLACGLQIDSYYYNSSQPSSRNSTLTLNDVPVVTNRDGDVKFAGNASNGHSAHVPNGFYMQDRASKYEPDDVVQDIRL